MNSEGTEIVAVESEANGLTLSDPGIIAIGLRAERMVIALKQIRAAVLKLTNERDWENLGGKPYLNEGGAKKVGTAFGVSWQLEEPVREEHEDGHFSYIVTGTFEFRGTKVEEMGTRSSRDEFFSKKKGRDIPPSEIDRNDVRKSAVTNCIGRGVKSLLALRNFTWDEISKAGIEESKVAKVTYKKPEGAAADTTAVSESEGVGKNPSSPSSDAPSFLSVGEILNRYRLCESPKEIAGVSNEADNGTYSEEERKQMAAAKQEAIRRMGKK